MKTLHVYPTARAIRHARLQWQDTEGLVPDLMRMDEFEMRSVTLGGRMVIDPLQRVLLMREAADFTELGVLGFERTLVKFFGRSAGLFRFFEELAREEVSLERLAEADAYAEFGEHLRILAALRERYRQLLEERGMTDTMFLPQIAQLNGGFVDQYERIEIHLEGLLSRYELRLLDAIAERTEVLLHVVASPYSTKMLQRLEVLGVPPIGAQRALIDLGQRQIRQADPAPVVVRARTVAVAQRYDQIAEAFVQMDRMVREGIAADRIALILPDEAFKEPFRLYDRFNNLNFAMGFDYTHGRSWKILDALSRHLRHPDETTAERLERYGVASEQIGHITAAGRMDAASFLARLEVLELSENDPLRTARVREARDLFVLLMREEELSVTEWLHLWLHQLSGIRIDDLRGGMVTVMGVLETRGVAYEGVVIVDFNDGIVPAMVTKDQFLNSQVRAFADLPTRSDREALQKHYYHRLLSRARDAVILYATGEERLPSKFLYELGLESAEPTAVPYGLLYDRPSRIVPESDPIVERFDASGQTWSASRLKTWLECKRKYYYRYIKGLPAKPENELNEGAFLHTLMDHLFREADRYEDPEEMRERLHRLMDTLLPDETPRIAYQKILWKRRLEPFIAQQIAHFRSGWRVVEREKEFAGQIGGLRFKGRIDRIDQDTTHSLLIDYKSGSLSEANRSKNLEEATDFQMNIYRHLVEGKYANAEPLFWNLFDRGDPVPAKALDEKETILGDHIHALRQTREFVAEKTEKLSRCTYCEFALLCGRGEYL